jgi:hypothetical protein
MIFDIILIIYLIIFSIKPDNFLMGIGRHCNKVC